MPASADLYTLGLMYKAKVTSATSAATGFPKENIVDYNPDTYWKPTSTANQTINIDLGSTQTIDQFALFIHNYETFGGTNTVLAKYDSNDDGNYTAVTTFASGTISNILGKPILIRVQK